MPAPPTGIAPQSTTAFTTPQDELDYIKTQATKFGLDPNAVLAVAAHEGVSLPSAVGDSGTSFGPWQLHQGGELPSTIWAQGPTFAQQWSNSPAGINYALAGISGYARGQTGPTAITTIVSKFERPANPAPEIANSIASYQQGAGPILGSNPSFDQISKVPGAQGSPLGGLPGGGIIQSGINTVEAPFKKAADAFNWLRDNLLRLGEILLGVILVIIGLLMLTKGMSPAGAVASAASKVR